MPSLTYSYVKWADLFMWYVISHQVCLYMVCLYTQSWRWRNPLSTGPLRSQIGSAPASIHYGTVQQGIVSWTLPCRPRGVCLTGTITSDERCLIASMRAPPHSTPGGRRLRPGKHSRCTSVWMRANGNRTGRSSWVWPANQVGECGHVTAKHLS